MAPLLSSGIWRKGRSPRYGSCCHWPWQVLLDHCRRQMLIERARFYFEKDRDYPAAWEPGGEDFFSPALIEADLMRRTLAPEAF